MGKGPDLVCGELFISECAAEALRRIRLEVEL